MSANWWPEDWLNTPIVFDGDIDNEFAGALVSQAFPPAIDGAVVPFVWSPLPHQIPPEGDWDWWLSTGGRGSGKTAGVAKWFDGHMSGPPCDPRIPGGHRGLIIAPTLGDAHQSCVVGPSGLQTLNPEVRSATVRGGTVVRWPNKSEARLLGAYKPQDVERLRAAGNACVAWLEELAAWPMLQEAWDQLQFGLRLGPHPRGGISTTPKNRKLIRMLIEDERVAKTHGTMEANPYIAESRKAALRERYEGTQLGLQELKGLLVREVRGAVATVDQLAKTRVLPDDVPALHTRIAVVDPASTDTTTSDAAGIAIGGVADDGDVYQLADASLKAPVSVWADVLVQEAVKWECGEIWYESNAGSDTYKLVIKAAVARFEQELEADWDATYASVPLAERPLRPVLFLPVKPVPAVLSKSDRAIALQMAIQQNRWHQVGTPEDFEILEHQLTTWVKGDPSDEDADVDDTDAERKKKKKQQSPDNLDAAVHLYRILKGVAPGQGYSGGSALRRGRR